LTTTGKPIAGRGINARLLDMVPGGRQVRYNRHPLYYYSEDKRPGDVKGQAFFDVWFVLAPRGTPIRK
jgi:predicted lipoprotein with Yx(FWY)xxD motif